MAIRSATGARIRALFLDIDGTVVRADEPVSPAVVAAVRRAQEHGCEVALCTGRTRYRSTHIARQLAMRGYLVTSNGGAVCHIGTGEIVYRRLISKPRAIEVVRAIVHAGGEPYVYEDSDRDGPEGARVLHHPSYGPGTWTDPARYRPHARLLEDLPFEPISISTFGPPESIRPLARRLRETLPSTLSIIESGSEFGWGIEIYVENVNKVAGLEAVAARLDIGRDETAAIGDHVNDLEMLRWAGLSIAMGNALPEVREAADFITGTVDEDGVATAIDRWILDGS